MTAYNPPEFNFSGLIFNPLIYEQGEGSTNSFTQITTGLLNTDNIQGIAPADNISLYTLTSGILQLGSSILSIINLYTAQLQMYSPIYFFYGNNTNQLWSTRFYTATNAISTIFYADSTVSGGVPAVSLQSKPLVVGSTTPYNGWYAMVTGKISMICSTQIDLETPLYNFYNVAKTMYKKMLYGAGGNIYEAYYADTISISETATSTISPYVAGDTIINNGNFDIACGAFQAISKRFTRLQSDVNYIYNFAGTAYSNCNFGINQLYGYFYLDNTNTLTVTSSWDIQTNTTTPLIANTGLINLTCGSLSLNTANTLDLGTTLGASGITTIGSSSSKMLLNCGLNPNYDTLYNATTGAPNGCIGKILAGDIYNAQFALTSGTSKDMITFTNLPVGVWMFIWNQQFSVPTTAAVITSINLSIGTTSLGTDVFNTNADCGTRTHNVGVFKSYMATQIYTNLVNTTDLYCNVNAVFTGTLTARTNSIATCKAVRIA